MPEPAAAGPQQRAIPVVCIGLSAGSVEPVRKIFRCLSPTTGMAFVVVHHLRRHFPTRLPEILERCTSMKVQLARPGVVVQPNQVYVLASGDEIAMSDHTLTAQPRTKMRGWSNVVSVFLNSLTASSHPAIAVILSGMDENGAAALRAFKQRGGIAIAQAPETAVHPSMPEAAIRTGDVDSVLAPDKIAGRLEQIARELKCTGH